MYKTYSYNNMPKAITEKPQPPSPPCSPSPPKPQDNKKGGGIFDGFETDDIILLVVIAILLLDDCEDKLLLAALAFVFLADYL
ncbi:MAG: hypothetical protein SOS24_07330 [Clostridia bacterium]|nr:hypothetical protein [Clostridia bacterium]